MKNVKFIFFTLIGLLIIIPMHTLAEDITNLNGVVMTEEEYNNFLKLHTHEYIMTMDEAKYEKLKSLDYNNVKTETVYIETRYNPSLQITTNKVITEEEYNSIDPNIMPILDDKGASLETSAKKFTLGLAGGPIWNYATTTATWKGIPTTRSFDVIGYRGYGFSFREGSQWGQQIYVENGEYKTIDYGWNGTNIKRFDNGFGISMNIVNTTINALQLTSECDVKATSDHPTLYSSYQHAVGSVTLAQSQNYTMGGAGLGRVFVYPYEISMKYDGMTGLYLEY